MKLPGLVLIVAIQFALAGCSEAPPDFVIPDLGQPSAPEHPPTPAQPIAPANPLAPGVLLEVPIDRAGPAIVPVQFKGKTYQFLLDTAMTFTSLDVRLQADLGPPISRGSVVTPGGKSERLYFAAPDANVGALSLKGLPYVSTQDCRGFSAATGKEIRGVLGMDILKNYVVRLDFDKGTLSIEEPRKAAEEDRGEAMALQYETRGIPYIIGKVMDKWDVKFLIDTCDCGGSSGCLHVVYFDSILESLHPATMPETSAIAGGIHRSSVMKVPSVRVGSLTYADMALSKDDFYSTLGWNWLSRHNVTLDFPNKKMYLRKGKQFNRRDGGG
jgi:hypothetical protein